MKIKAVFFDAGETLVHRNPSLVKLVRRALSESHARVTNRAVEKAAAKCAVSMKNIVENGRMSDSQKWDVYMKSMFKELRLSDEPLRQRIKERLKAGTSFRQYPEVPAVIRTLREQKMVLGVISNAPAELEGILRRTGLYHKFDYILISEKEGIEKPEPGIFLRAVKKAGVKKGEFLYVGDNYLADINGARRAGVIPVWLTRRTEHAQFSFKDAAKNDGVARIKALKELVPLMKKEGWI